MSERIIVTLYEPRWHGFARWRIERRIPTSKWAETAIECESGWLRRRRGSRCIEIVVSTDRWQAYYETGNPESVPA